MDFKHSHMASLSTLDSFSSSFVFSNSTAIDANVVDLNSLAGGNSKEGKHYEELHEVYGQSTATGRDEKILVEDGREISIEEQVVIFLLTVGHNECDRACQNTFQHSSQTISKYVNLILQALCQLGKEYISRLNDDTPSKICFNPCFYPYFKDCLGAIDGTHIPVCVHTS
ncbi:hypothetical protein EJ110_NYTH30353 [Nymphaea thermarum]|nr:hypothetical protein EJ110_NYTH30353 [Nymphaea thermarum]